MFPPIPVKKFTFLWIFFLLHQQNAVNSAKTIIAECEFGSSNGSEPPPSTNTVEFRCSSNQELPKDISPEIRANSTILHCINGISHVDKIASIFLRVCNFTTLPAGLLENFKNLTGLNIDGLSFVELRGLELPSLLTLSSKHLTKIPEGTFGRLPVLINYSWPIFDPEMAVLPAYKIITF